MTEAPKMTTTNDPLTAFVEAAIWHGSLARAEAILAAHPELASSDILTIIVNSALYAERSNLLKPTVMRTN